VIGLVPMLGGLLALAQSIQDGLPGALASETLNFALAALFNILFAGVTFILYGLAVAWSRQYPRWLGWVVVAAGIGSVAAGLLQATVGEPTALSRVLTIIFPTVITLWLVDRTCSCSAGWPRWSAPPPLRADAGSGRCRRSRPAGPRRPGRGTSRARPRRGWT
jgi:hypothetical protein